MGKKIRRNLLPNFNIRSFVFGTLVIMAFISMLAEIFIPSYDTNSGLYPLLGIIAGLFYRGGINGNHAK